MSFSNSNAVVAVASVDEAAPDLAQQAAERANAWRERKKRYNARYNRRKRERDEAHREAIKRRITRGMTPYQASKAIAVYESLLARGKTRDKVARLLGYSCGRVHIVANTCKELEALGYAETKKNNKVHLTRSGRFAPSRR